MLNDASITIDYIFIPYNVTGIEPTVTGRGPTVVPEAMRVCLTLLAYLTLLVSQTLLV